MILDDGTRLRTPISLRDAARYLRVPYHTLRRWLQYHPDEYPPVYRRDRRRRRVRALSEAELARIERARR